MATPFIGVYATSYGPYAAGATTTPAAPAVVYNSTTRTLTASHSLGGTIQFSYQNSAFVDYIGAIQVDGAQHNPGDWKFKRLASTGYNESSVADSPAIAAKPVNAGAHPVGVEGNSRSADERPRFFGSGYPAPQPGLQGYLNPWLNRAQAALAGNADFTKFDNWATYGDDISSGGMLHPVELDEVQSSWEVGSVNLLFLHHYVNNLHAAVGGGQTDVSLILASCQQAVQDYMTAITARATAAGVTLRVIQFADPSSMPAAFNSAQHGIMEQCIAGMRNWLRMNYQSLGITVLCDLCSDSRFFGLNTPSTSPFYLNESGAFVHYSPDGHQYICDTFAVPALYAAAAGTSTIIEVAIVAPNDPLVVTTLEDTDYGTQTTGLETDSVTGQPAYSAGTTRRSQQTATEAILTRTLAFAGTAPEYIKCFAFISSAVQVAYQVDGGAWTVVANPPTNTVAAPVATISGLSAGSHTISFRFTNVNAGALPFGSCNWDKLEVASRVPIGGGSGTAPQPVITTEYNEDDSFITLTNFEATSVSAAPYSAGTTRHNQQGEPVAYAAITANFTGTAEEGIDIGGVFNGVRARYRIDGGAWQALTQVGSGPNQVAWSIFGPPAGSHTITVEFTNSDGVSPLPYGNCILDFVRKRSRV